MAGKFGGELNLAVWQSIFATTKLNLPIFHTCHICMAMPYRTAKFKSTNTFAMAIWGPTTKFNSRQDFQLYGMMKPMR